MTSVNSNISSVFILTEIVLPLVRLINIVFFDFSDYVSVISTSKGISFAHSSVKCRTSVYLHNMHINYCVVIFVHYNL